LSPKNQEINEMSNATPKSDAIKGTLYDLLVRKLPLCVNEGGNLCVAELSERLGMSPEGVYRWLRSNEISKKGRAKLIALSAAMRAADLFPEDHEQLTENDLRPFL
jgi:hypothetical protein